MVNVRNELDSNLDVNSNTSEFPPLNERVQQEKITRPERVKRLTERVDYLFPGPAYAELRRDIVRTFDVPQWGPYHNEGMYMDTHLDAILVTIDRIQSDDLPDVLSDDLMEILKRVCGTNLTDLEKKERLESLERYTLLHDISKPDCLTIKYSDEVAKEITWEEWTELLPLELRDGSDPVAFAEFCETAGIVSISYFQDKTDGGKKHGDVGADRIKDLEIVNPLLETAVRYHEVGYQFDGIQVSTFENFFANLTPEEQDWVITASFIDLQGSYGKNGKPDVSPVFEIMKSRTAFLIIKEVERKLLEDLASYINAGELKIIRLENIFDTLKKTKVPLADAESLVNDIKKELGFVTYDKIKVRKELEALIPIGTISQDQVDQVITILDSGDGRKLGKAMGRELGKTMNVVRQVLDSSIVD